MTEIIIIGFIAIVFVIEINMFLYVQKRTARIVKKCCSTANKGRKEV